MEKAQAKVDECWSKLNVTKLPYTPPSVDFQLKGRAAGMATDFGRRISINFAFVAKYADDVISQVIPHEVVHCWLVQTRHPSHVTFGRRNPHGYAFMTTLASLGCRMERTHDYQLDAPPSGRSTRKYVCPSCDRVFWLTDAKHKKIQTGVQCWCPTCGRSRGQIKYAG